MQSKLVDKVSGILQRALAGYTEDYKHHDADGRTYIQWGKVERDMRAAITEWESMPDMTTTEAAAYLAEHNYTVHSKRDGTDKPPASELVKRWCISGKLKARKSGWVWLISKDELDRLLSVNVAVNVAAGASSDSDTAPEGQK